MGAGAARSVEVCSAMNTDNSGKPDGLSLYTQLNELFERDPDM